MTKKTLTLEKTESTTIKVGRPRKTTKSTKPKLTLEQKQEIKLQAQKAKDAARIARGETEPKNKDRFYCTNKELQAELINWRDSAEQIEDRIPSEELGRMLLAIANKLLNHSNFRNYPNSLKEDMRGYGLYKVLRGLKHYNFKFNNPFAWVTLAFYNSYLTVISKHYKDINIKKDLMERLMTELQSINGISPNNSISKCIANYLNEDAGEGNN